MFTNAQYAMQDHFETHNVDDFVYDGCVGFEALNLFMVYNEVRELDLCVLT